MRPSIDFHAQHSPFGAYASFTLGKLGQGGGFGLELGGPARQDVFIACRQGRGPVRGLPFFSGAQDSKASFSAGAAQPRLGDPKAPEAAWEPFKPGEISRTLGAASDRWQAGPLSFTLLSPFGPVPDPARAPRKRTAQACLPAVLAILELDNRKGRAAAWAFFGIGNGEAGPLRRLSQDSRGALRGVASQGSYGLACLASAGAEELVGWNAATLLSDPQEPCHLLGRQGGLRFHVPAGQMGRFVIALGFFRHGRATTGIPAAYLYTRHFDGLEAVLLAALRQAPRLQAQAADRDRELEASGLSAERRFLLAHAVHSYYGSTQLLHDGRAPLWVVNEGEYRMMNTFDLTVDHCFFELAWHPWAVRDALDLFARRYAYRDRLKPAPDAPASLPGGLSFCHDMGVANQFSPPSRSSYELAGQSGLFSHMSAEQLCNWVLCAAAYARRDRAWLKARSGLLKDCLKSLERRGSPRPGRLQGGVRLDSSRCGDHGQEITTYDSLDASLGQARNNLYLFMKLWAAGLALEQAFTALGLRREAGRAAAYAMATANAVEAGFDAKAGYIPAVFEAGNRSRILPAVEGLAFVWQLGLKAPLAPNGAYASLLAKLAWHSRTCLAEGHCIDRASGGLKISSSSHNTWMSKVFLAQAVLEKVLGFELDPAFDRVHAAWQRGPCGPWAFTDQVDARNGRGLGSRYYPRGVTAWLWLAAPLPRPSRKEHP